MLRVIPDTTSNGPDADVLIALLAVEVADHPHQVQQLLLRFGLAPEKDPQAIISQVFQAIDTQGKAFHLELAQLLSEKLSARTTQDQYVDAIAGAVGAIANTVGGFAGKKQKQRDASRQTFSALIAYKAQQEQNAAKQAQYAHARSSQTIWLTALGILGLVGLLGWGYYQSQKTASPGKGAALT